MQFLLTTPAIGWLLLAVLAIEAIGLAIFWRVRHIGLPPAQITAFLGAGAFFALALISVLSQWPAVVTGAVLFGAFCCHAADLWLRWHG